VIYQAVGYKLRKIERGGPAVRLVPMRRGERTTHFNVACADADHLAESHPDLTWTVETLGASQQVRR
jgi:uncharacterized protein YqjF (DUF2071 family)